MNAPAPLLPTPPGSLGAYARMLLRPRPGLRPNEDVPLIVRRTGMVKLNADWLAAYRALIGLPEDDPVLPPLALQLAAAPLHLEIMADPRFPFRPTGLVHVAQRVDQAGTILPGASVRLEAYTGPGAMAPNGTHLELVTEARREDGKLLWRSVALLLARHRLQGEPTTMSPPSTLISSLLSELPIEPQVWLRRGVVAVPEDLGRRYAAIGRDWNPIHRRAWLARPFGHERAVAQNSWALARAMVAAGWPLHPAFSLHAQFRKPVPLPSTVTVWVHRGKALQTLRVTDEDGVAEHLTLRVEPALAWVEG